ncbi:MAG TPA: Holliday junction branch migration protein RuvA [Candidatus Polarisedimenticolia bacterium]|nr:Holliday junction branch migration protein RuvA [Candidatus Polarisedimenticolia bacterium]
MIARLTGRILEKEPHQVILEAGGVGYRVAIPLSTYYVIPDAGEGVTLRIHTHVREDLIALYGFSSQEELALFERLIEISGIGPRLALAILSGLPAGDLVAAITQGDTSRLRGIPGIGAKTADRVILELRGRLSAGGQGSVSAGKGSGRDGTVRGDVVSALVNLGYRESQAQVAVDEVLRERAADAPAPEGRRRHPEGPTRPAGADPNVDLQEILKRSLKHIAS